MQFKKNGCQWIKKIDEMDKNGLTWKRLDENGGKMVKMDESEENLKNAQSVENGC